MERRGSRPYRRGSRKQTKAEEQAERLAELNRRDASRGTGTETVTKAHASRGTCKNGRILRGSWSTFGTTVSPRSAQ